MTVIKIGSWGMYVPSQSKKQVKNISLYWPPNNAHHQSPWEIHVYWLWSPWYYYFIIDSFYYYIACIGHFLLVTDTLSVVHHCSVCFILTWIYVSIHTCIYLFPDERI